MRKPVSFMRKLFAVALVLLLSSYPTGKMSTALGSAQDGVIRTVFIILMENHNWSSIKHSPSAPYINGTLLPKSAHAEQYYNPPRLHPSDPNSIRLPGAK